MANVVDPDSWRMIPVPDPQHSKHAAEPVDGKLPRTHSAAAQRRAALEELTGAITDLFSAPGDRVVWSLSNGLSDLEAGGTQLRVDAQHELGAPASDFIGTHNTEQTDVQERPWLVLVESADEVRRGRNSERLRAAVEHDAQLLVLVCELDQPAQQTGDATPAERIAKRLHCDFVLVDAGVDSLTKTLDQVRQRGRSTVLFVDAQRSTTPPPHFRPDDRDAERPDGSETRPARLRQVAAEMLTVLAESDARIAAYSSDVDPVLPMAWESLSTDTRSAEQRVAFALEHCAALCTLGRRPFLFLSADEALNQLGLVRRSICLEQRAVTLIIESRGGGGVADDCGSASLSGLRTLPHTALLSPKDGAELCQMLEWCARQSDPSVVWLPEPWEPPVSWPEGTEIAHGRAERLGKGDDVTIVAWGPQTAAAAIAAESLAQQGIGATVVNARFAHPLDVETILEACDGAAYVVIVDDAPCGGGFASWVSEQLVQRKSVQDVSIVSTPSVAEDERPLHSECADAIVDRCRWLGTKVANDPIVSNAELMPNAGADCAATFVPPNLVVPGINVQQQVLARQFSPFIQRWVDQYANVGSRDVYLWRWCLHGLDLTTLSCVDRALRLDLCDTKLLAVMYGVMLDDVADQAGSDEFLAALTGIIAGEPTRDFSRFSSEQQQYARFTCDLWDTFRDRLQAAPCYQDYTELLDFDHRQILNTFAYSCMINKQPLLMNLPEHDVYLPHNMQMMSFATMDMMCSPTFDRRETGRLREVIWHAQSMGRIGNLVSTWQREIGDRDFTSGVFARALRQGDVTLEDLRWGSAEKIEVAIRNGRHEQYFLQKWEAHRQCIRALAPGIHSVNIETLLEALARLLQMELGSRGLK